MWLNGLCCGGLCGVGEVLKGGQQHPFDDRQDQEELNPCSDCGTHGTRATPKARPHVVMGCTPSILSSNNQQQQQQQQHPRKDSSSLYGGNLSNAGSGTLVADNNGASGNKFTNNAALNQAQMLGYGQGGKDVIAGGGGAGPGEKVICFDFVVTKLYRGS